MGKIRLTEAHSEAVEALHDSVPHSEEGDPTLEAMGNNIRLGKRSPTVFPPSVRKQLAGWVAVGENIVRDVVEETDETTTMQLYGEAELAELLDLEGEAAALDEHHEEFYPHHLGASDHDHTIAAIADDVSVWHLASPRAPVQHVEAPRVQRFVDPEQLRVIEGVAARVYVDDEEAAELARDGVDELWQKVVGKEVPTNLTVKDERIVRELHAHVTASGAVAPEEMLDVLLTEGKRILWNRAERGEDDQRPHAPAVENKSTVQVKQKTPAEEVKEQEMIRQMYGRVTGSGAADAEGILDYLLVEAKKSAASAIFKEEKDEKATPPTKWKSKL
ncbi:hypothetical protein BJ742DRAFT_835210 [Cladochytrium replicatum]|nr:hypothetical protein BJ742DRAFT_835210 [Cladochytrium replicatum]